MRPSASVSRLRPRLGSCAMPGPTIEQASGDGDVATARELFREYASELGLDLSFQGFDRELDGAPGRVRATDRSLVDRIRRRPRSRVRRPAPAIVGHVRDEAAVRARPVPRNRTRPPARAGDHRRGARQSATAGCSWTRCLRWTGRCRSTSRSGSARSSRTTRARRQARASSSSACSAESLALEL